MAPITDFFDGQGGRNHVEEEKEVFWGVFTVREEKERHHENHYDLMYWLIISRLRTLPSSWSRTVSKAWRILIGLVTQNINLFDNKEHEITAAQGFHNFSRQF